MRPITGLHLNAVCSPVTGEQVKGLRRTQRPDEETKGRALRPMKKDEYVPEDKKTPSGRYWMDKDENGKLRVHFDDPSRTEDPITGNKKVGAANEAGTVEYLGDVKAAEASGKAAQTEALVDKAENAVNGSDRADASDGSIKADEAGKKQMTGVPGENGDKKADGPEEDGKKANGSDEKKKVETCTGDTSKVDREIEKLKRKKKELEQKVNRESDPDKAEDLKKQLAQVERELSQKDNDSYRRRHTVFH